MKRNTRFVCMLIVLILIGSSVGCMGSPTENKDNEATITSSKNVEKEPPTEIRMIIAQYSDLAVDKATPIEEEIEKKLNIKLIKQVAPGDSLKTKQNVLIASGSLDILSLDSASYYDNAVKGNLMDLGELLDTKLPLHKQNIEKWPELKKLMQVKGKIYGVTLMPNLLTKEAGAAPLTNSRINIRKDWLTKLGLPVPKTIDQVFETAKAFYNADPDGVGKDKLCIISACNGFSYLNLDWVFGAFGVAYDVWYADSEGKVQSYDVSTGMKEAIEWLREAYKENLLDKDIFTQKEPQLKDKVVNDQVGFWGAHWGVQYATPWPREQEEKKLRAEGKLKADEKYQWNKDEPMLYWEPIDPPKGPRGESGMKTVQAVTIYPRCIPKNEDPKKIDAICRLLEYSISKEGGMLLSYGIEGVDYVMGANGPIPGPVVGDKDYNQYRQERGIDSVTSVVKPLWKPSSEFEWGYLYDVDKEKYGKYAAEQIVLNGMKWANPKLINVVQEYALVNSDTPQIAAKLNTLRDEYFAKFVVGELPMDKWDEYVQKWYSNGGEELIGIYSQNYKERM